MDKHPIETAPRDGRPLLLFDARNRCAVGVPKRYPRPLVDGDDLTISKPGDRWEVFRDEEVIPGHTWIIVATHWAPLPDGTVALVAGER